MVDFFKKACRLALRCIINLYKKMFDDREGQLGEMPEERFEGTNGSAEERVERRDSMISFGGVERTDLQIQRDTILVVEDDAAIRNVVRLFLGNLLPEFKVVLAEDPIQAIEFLRQGLSKQVAMIWTDNKMPNMMGRDFVQILKGATIGGHSLSKEILRDLANVPVMMATSDGSTQTADLLERGVINDVLPKPFSLASAREVVVPMARGPQAMA